MCCDMEGVYRTHPARYRFDQAVSHMSHPLGLYTSALHHFPALKRGFQRRCLALRTANYSTPKTFQQSPSRPTLMSGKVVLLLLAMYTPCDRCVPTVTSCPGPRRAGAAGQRFRDPTAAFAVLCGRCPLEKARHLSVKSLFL
jgi:hypothetical protein